MDLFKKTLDYNGPIGELKNKIEGKFAFPKLNGTISNKVNFNEKELICWSYNNYLGLANNNEILEIDSFAQQKWGLTYPMGSRMMTGDTYLHDEFENNFAEFVKMENAMLLNFGYQGMLSVIDSLLSKNDIVISDAQCHACVIDGIRLHKGTHLIYDHNDIKSLEKKLIEATEIIKATNGGILVITEGVFSMSGEQGKIIEICDLKKSYEFRLLVDDAHGFGVMGQNGNGIVCSKNLEHEVDLYFTTFTKSMVSFGAIIAGKKEIINYFKYNLRSQIFSKSLPMPIVYGLNERLKIVKNADENRKKLFETTHYLHDGLKERNLLNPKINSVITPIYFDIKLDNVFTIQQELIQNHGVFCSVIIYPVVPKDKVIFRITPTSLHTKDDVTKTLNAFDIVFKKYI